MTVNARVVTRRDDARLAIFLTSVAALGLALVLADDIWHLSRLPPLLCHPEGSSAVYAVVAALIALGGLGPWLAWTTRRGRAVAVRREERAVRIGRQRLVAQEVSALSVARATLGYGVAITRAREVTFLELERPEDAARVASSLGVEEPPFGATRPAPRSRVLALPQALLSLVAVTFAAAYLMVTTHGYAPWSFPDPKAFFGIGGVVAAELSMVLLLVRRFLPGQALGMSRRGAWDAHVTLHTGAREARPHVAADEPARIQNLGRGDEPVRTWLARVDAMPTEHHAYRGDALQTDMLWETLGDAGAPVDARMAAARVLRRRYGQEEAALVRVVDDPDVRVRVEAAMEDEQEDAEHHLEKLGPLFRAR